MRTLAILTLLGAAGLVVAADAPQGETAKQDLQQLQGTWKLVSLEVNGKKSTGQGQKTELTMKVQGNQFTSTLDDKHTFKGTFKLDPTRKPRTVDFAVTEGDYQGKTLLGIYEISGDTLRAAYAGPGKERPKEFASATGSEIFNYVYQRAKP